MTPNQFQATAISILNTAFGWQTRIARVLGISDRSVRKWLKNGKIPDWVENEFARLTGKTEISPWPRDEWVIGTAFNEQGKPREYIAHLQYPRFIARIVVVDDNDQAADYEQPADVQSGVVYGVDDETVLCEISFIDPLDNSAMRQWLEAAGDEIEKVSAIEEALSKNSPPRRQ